jgi:hypothetical protein
VPKARPQDAGGAGGPPASRQPPGHGVEGTWAAAGGVAHGQCLSARAQSCHRGEWCGVGEPRGEAYEEGPGRVAPVPGPRAAGRDRAPRSTAGRPKAAASAGRSGPTRSTPRAGRRPGPGRSGACRSRRRRRRGRDVEALLHERGQLAVAHREAAVARTREDPPPGGGRADRCGQRVAERPPAHGVLQPPGTAHAGVAAHPVARHGHVDHHVGVVRPGVLHSLYELPGGRGRRVRGQTGPGPARGVRRVAPALVGHDPVDEGGGSRRPRRRPAPGRLPRRPSRVRRRPDRSRSTSRRPGRGIDQPRVAMASNAVPMPTSRSPRATRCATSGSCGGASTTAGVPASRPRAAQVSTTGAATRAASPRTAAAAPAATAPPPTQMTGRRARSSRRAASSSSCSPGSGTGRTEGVGAAGASAARTSAGMPTYTGPYGGERARPIAVATAATASSASSGCSTALASGPNTRPGPPTRAAAHARPAAVRPGRRGPTGTSLASSSTGERLAAASPKAATALAAPGPLVTSATPSRPVARASPSAAYTALCSCRTGTMAGVPPTRQKGRLCTPGSPKTCVTPGPGEQVEDPPGRRRPA